MNIAEILNLIKEVTGINVVGVTGKPVRQVTHARYVAIQLMMEEGYSAKLISSALKINRTMPGKSSVRINNLFTPGCMRKESREFKALYLSCVKTIADLEDVA